MGECRRECRWGEGAGEAVRSTGYLSALRACAMMLEMKRGHLVAAVLPAILSCKSNADNVAPRPAPPVAVPEPPKTPTTADRLDAAHTLAAAVDVLRPQMSDEVGKDSAAAIMLTLWGITNPMRWSEVAVSKDETGFALIQKDPDSERGKRFCTSGNVVEIHVEKLTGTEKYFHGLLMNGAGSLYRFYAVGSTGSIVESTSARFCGVAVGKYDYSNSAGGVGHAVAAVGMFDLPENHDRVVKATGAAPVTVAAHDRAPSSESQPNTPTLRHGTIQVDGPRTADAVQKVVGQRFDRFRACYDAGLRKNPTLADNLAALKEGTVSVRFIIDRSGNVSAASEQGSDLPDRGVSSCVVGAFGTLSFPPGEGTVAVVYPVIFSAS